MTHHEGTLEQSDRSSGDTGTTSTKVWTVEELAALRVRARLLGVAHLEFSPIKSTAKATAEAHYGYSLNVKTGWVSSYYTSHRTNDLELLAAFLNGHHEHFRLSTKL